MTEFRVESQNESRRELLPVKMAALVGRRVLLRALNAPLADRSLVTASCCSRHHVLPGNLRPLAFTTRRYSSESKDDLRVRYLDGEDAGKCACVRACVFTCTRARSVLDKNGDSRGPVVVKDLD